MKSFFRQDWMRRFGASCGLLAIVALMTGPSGQADTPALGLTGSFFGHNSFFGLFAAPRWTVFLTVAIMFTVIWMAWQRHGQLVRQGAARLTSTPRAFLDRPVLRGGLVAVVAILVFIMPSLVQSAYWRAAMVEQIAVYVLLALGLNVVVGFAGLLDLGFVAFYAIGAYATAWVTGALPLAPPFHHALNPFWAIPISIAIAMFAGVILGTPTLRLRGDYLAIVTLGFGEIITLFLNNLFNITGGATGTNAIPHFSLHLGPVKYIWGLDPVPYYRLIIVFVFLFIVIFSALNHSRIGRSWTAIREDEVAAESLGINPLKYKVMAFAIGAASAGFAGVITAGQDTFLGPSSFSLSFSINILVLVIFGGMGSILGVVIGAAIIQIITMWLLHSPPSGFMPPDLFMYLGALLMVMMVIRPAGLVPARRRRREITQAADSLGHANDVLLGDGYDD